MKKFLSVLMVLVLCFGLCACGGDGLDTTDGENNSTDGENNSTVNQLKEPTSRTEDSVGFQLELPEVGEKIAVLETSKGDIYIRLFPESAPKTVENFIGLIEKGYYDGLLFHRVINNFMIQGGDPLGNGTGGESMWGGKFEDEFNANLLNIRGSLAMANSGLNTNGSQFFINQTKTPVTKDKFQSYDTLYAQLLESNGDSLRAEYEQYKSQLTEYANADAYVKGTIDNYIGKTTIFTQFVSDEVWELYKNGGNIHLDGAFKGGYGGHSVFGQVFIGMDVVDAIAFVQVDSSNKPVNDVVIKKAYTTTVTEDMLSKADSVSSEVSE